MDLKEYRELAHSYRYNGNNEISLDLFFMVLSMAENLEKEKEEYRQETCRLYDKYCQPK